MNLDTWLAAAGMGWREAVVGIIALLGLYILFVLLRLKRLARRCQEAAAPAPKAPSLGEVGDDGDDEAGDEHPDPVYSRPEKPAFAWNEPPAKDFAEEQYYKAVQLELGQLREEVAVLRHEFATLREEMRGQVGQIKASQNMSPLYSDAMQMAMLGHDAETIAERCGIARAEADLVVALARNQGD
ncbi:DUF2802 domain-containing protein [Azospira oryzae]|uniref:DUF2802 domain-containing protein n=1 Tax=Azospira oryzae TaxID=146939 RepID=UPI0019646320|nr:DUF2802 domain-containing protein [Azospira oryzae]